MNEVEVDGGNFSFTNQGYTVQQNFDQAVTKLSQLSFRVSGT
jgi:hypothetical protein